MKFQKTIGVLVLTEQGFGWRISRRFHVERIFLIRPFLQYQHSFMEKIILMFTVLAQIRQL